MNFETLTQIGIPESEIKVYFALLKLESSTVGKIIEESKVSDSKIYSILEKLKEKGLVSFVIKNNVKHFQATNPKNLLKIITEKEKTLREQKQELLHNIIPQIEKRRKLTEDKQQATIYESFNGIKSAFNLILENLRTGEEYNVFMSGEALRDKKVVRFFQNYHKQRIEKRVKVRLLSESKFKNTIKKHHLYKGMHVRITQQKLPIGTFIFKNHVMTVVWGEKPTAFVIESKKNYEYYKTFFEDLWKTAKTI